MNIHHCSEPSNGLQDELLALVLALNYYVICVSQPEISGGKNAIRLLKISSSIFNFYKQWQWN